MSRLHNLSERKAVIRFSSGIERTGEDNQVQLRATLVPRP
jgi:hypothetical protein